MDRRRSLISNRQIWTETVEWKSTTRMKLEQSGFPVDFPLSRYDAENHFIFSVSGNGNLQIPVNFPDGERNAVAWECDIRIDTPAEINGFKMTLRMNNIGAQLYVIKSLTDGYASILYDDNIPNSGSHDLQSGILIKDIKLGEWTRLRIEARGKGQDRTNQVFINQQLAFSTTNASTRWANINRVMWQSEGNGLLRYLKFQYL